MTSRRFIPLRALGALFIATLVIGCSSSSSSGTKDGGNGTGGNVASGGTGGATGQIDAAFNIDALSLDGLNLDALLADANLPVCASTVAPGGVCAFGTAQPCQRAGGSLCACVPVSGWTCL